ncbi:tRNA epoxyqueuosine(34) reductase QueG [Paraferrimonas sp. SM1919]|uniref:tRNA epoxyqueuosine(34) reductase QueG n=1 Tax=Paraferrimonas sp. SM1919 TaxID=2662263 RepID=UPI0013D2A214|nr:tRNA epoxyqueuosine(34) reductase QueG [Paraferrimonas sp. SM1919]
MSASLSCEQLQQLANQIKQWGLELGFAQVGISDIDLEAHALPLQKWLDEGMHGSMNFMAEHGSKRYRPAELHPGTLRVVTVRMNYLPPNAKFASNLKDPLQAYISRYSLGRDYHKMMRNRLKKLGQKIAEVVPEYQGRPFVDSAPVMERALAEKSGLGWTGKHSLLLNEKAGSWFFLGELFVNLPLPTDTPVKNQCGSCVACKTICPTNAIVADGVVDARRCISYLTIEHDGAIPIEFRQNMGNRIYGCDDCQLVCPFNREAPVTKETDFHARSELTTPQLLELFSWSEQEFLDKTQGSAIRRIGHKKWLRNLSIALGNACYSEQIIQALEQANDYQESFLQEHYQWALQQQALKEQRPFSHQRSTQRLIRVINKGLPRDS